VSFNGETNKGGQSSDHFDCGELLSFSGADEVKCRWTDSQTLYVGVSGSLSLYPGDIVSVLGDSIYSSDSVKSCNSSYALGTVNATLTAPSDAVTPSVLFSSIQQLYDFCVDVSIDASGSIVGCLPTYEWSLVGSSSDNTTSLENLLNSANSDSLDIDNAYLNGGSWYALKLSASNCLGKNSSNVANFTMAAAAVPSLTIDGGFSQSIYSYNSLSLTARGTSSSCGDFTCSDALTYTWNVLYNPQVDFTSTLNTFSLSSGSLNASSIYYIQCKVSDCFSNENTVVVKVTTLTSDLVATIAGGTMRTVSESDILIMDGSNSYDPDGGKVGYTWSCSDAIDNPCGQNATGSESVMKIGKYMLPDNSTREPYAITLEIDSISDDRTASYTQWIYVEAEEVPSIDITTTATKFNPTESNTISATLDTTSGKIKAVWSVSDSSTDLEYGNSLSANILGAYTKTFPENSYGGLATFNLQLKSGAIDTEGSSYTLKLTATFQDSGASSMATITFVSNSAPTSGSLAVSPDSGYVLQTAFDATLSGWVDDDTPLLYTFYLMKGSTSASCQTIQASSYANSASDFYLPAGTIYIKGVITDSLGAETESVSSGVEVTQHTQLSTTNLTSLASTAISSALLNNDFDSVASTLSALTSSVVDTSIDCSAALWSYCSTLHRDNCSETANTCGECLDGYDGKSGDANTVCVYTDGCHMDGTMDGNETDIDCGGSVCAPCADGDGCEVDSDCESGICESGVCTEQTKSCPMANGLECNGGGAGTCNYKHKQSGKAMPASWCGESNVQCSAYCVCNSTYYTGSKCSMTQEQKEAALEAVVLVFENMATVFDSYDGNLDPDDVETYSAILSSSTSDVSMFDEDAASTALSVLESVVSGSDSISSTAAADILSAISNLLSYTFSSSRRSLAERQLLTSTESTLIKHLVTTCESLVSSESEGYSTDTSEDEVQMTYGAYYGADLCFFIDQSQSTDQSDAGLAASGLKLCEGLEDATIYEICSFSFTSTDVPDSTVSTVYKIVTSTRDDSRRRLSESNNSDIIRIGFTSDYNWVDESIFRANGSCPGSYYYSEDACGGYNISCSAEYSGYELECVSNSSYPVCASYNNDTDTYDLCQTVNYTSSAVYCDCGISDGIFVAEAQHSTGYVTVSYTAASPTVSPTILPTTPSPSASPTSSPTESPTVVKATSVSQNGGSAATGRSLFVTVMTIFIALSFQNTFLW